MKKKVKIIGKSLERIEVIGQSLPRVEPAEFAAGLGAETWGERRSKHLDLISLGAIGNELINHLHSMGAKSSLVGQFDSMQA